MLVGIDSSYRCRYITCIVLLWFSVVRVADAEYQRIHEQQYQPSTSLDDTIQQRNLTQRIIGGTLANESDFPSFVFSGCGGTLIHPDIILTAAHCTGFFKGNYAQIGGIQRNGSDSENIKSIKEIPHPKYVAKNNRNDIMLVVLANTSSRPLQKLNFDNNIPAVDDVVTAAGFGLIKERASYQGNLRKVDVNIVSYVSCKEALKWQYSVYDDVMICAGVPGGGKDTCVFDSGGPLYTSNGVQVGITSFGIGCGRPGKPGVYTRISPYSSWIHKLICKHSSVPPSSCFANVPTPSPVPTPYYCPCTVYTMWLCRLVLRCQ